MPIQILYKSYTNPSRCQVQVDANPCCLLGIAFTIPFQILVVSLMFQYLIFRIFEYKLEHFSPHLFSRTKLWGFWASLQPILSDMPPDTISWSYIKLRGLSASLQPTYKYIFPDISPHDINIYITRYHSTVKNGCRKGHTDGTLAV